MDAHFEMEFFRLQLFQCQTSSANWFSGSGDRSNRVFFFESFSAVVDTFRMTETIQRYKN